MEIMQHLKEEPKISVAINSMLDTRCSVHFFRSCKMGKMQHLCGQTSRNIGTTVGALVEEDLKKNQTIN